MAGGWTARRRASLGAGALLGIAFVLASCGKVPHEGRPAWRDEAERACLRSGVVKESAYITRGPELDGPGVCGALSPFKVAALSDGKVGLTYPASLAQRGHKAYAATLTCEMVPALESWMSEKVQTAAAAVYGQPVIEMHTLGSYSCRRMNNGTGTNTISEHAFADAIDVAGFTLADGREVMVRTGWRGSPEDQDFLRSVFVGACDIFHTVLGPGSDGHHEDHFHLDLMRHARDHHICRPIIKYEPRSAPPIAAPAQPPVPPGQMQPEPESDDPYALEDMPVSRRSAVASAREPAEPEIDRAPPASIPQRRTDVAVAPLAPARGARLDAEDGDGGRFERADTRGDRLDRTVASPSYGGSGMRSAEGNSAYAKDSSRLGGDQTQRSNSAYAALRTRQPSYGDPEPPPRPAAPSSLPPGWRVGAQPAPRAPDADSAPTPLSGADDPDM